MPRLTRHESSSLGTLHLRYSAVVNYNLDGAKSQTKNSLTDDL